MLVISASLIADGSPQLGDPFGLNLILIARMRLPKALSPYPRKEINVYVDPISIHRQLFMYGPRA
jgi:hypothetical protein